MEDLARIKGNVAKMASMNAPEEDIDGYIASEGVTLDDIRNYKIPAALTNQQEMIRPFARAVRSGLSGVAGIADIGGLAVEPIRQGLRSGLESLGVDFMGQNTPYIPPSQGVKNIFDSLTGGIAAPRSEQEKIVDIASEALSGGGAMKGLQTGAELAGYGGGEILKKLAPQTGAELAAAGGAGAGAEYAKQEYPDNSIAPILGALAGGMVTIKGVESARGVNNLNLLDKAYFTKQAQKEALSAPDIFQNQAINILGKNLQSSPEKLMALKSQLEQDKNLILADIGGDEVQALTRQVGKFRGGARNDIDRFLTTRDKNAGQRIINMMNDKVSGVDKYYGSLDELATTRSNLAQEQYTNAYDTHRVMKITPSLNKFIQDGRFQNALADARKEGLINIEQPVNSLQTLDAVYRRLRDKAGEFYSRGQGDAGTVYKDFAKSFVQRLDQEAPEYAKARNTFSGFSDLMEAQNAGLEYASKRPEEIAKTLRDMTTGERDAYKIGVRESIEKRVLNSGLNADEAAKIFGRPENRQQLRVILGNDYSDFSQQLRKEIRFANTKFKILGGSRTDYNTIEDGQFIEKATNIIRNGRAGISDEIINTIADSIKRKYLGINTDNSKILAKALVTNKGGIKTIDNMLLKSKSPSEKLLLRQFKQNYGYLLIPTTIGSK